MEDKSGLSIADALAIARGTNDGNGNNNGLLGGEMGLWWIIIIVLFFSYGNGWGNNGRNNGNSGNGGGTVVIPAGNFGFNSGYNPCCSPATTQGMADAFNFNNLDNAVRIAQNAATEGAYQNNLAITSLGTNLANNFCTIEKTGLQNTAALQSTLCQGFGGINNAITNTGFETQSAMNSGFNNVQATLCNGFNGLQSAIATTNCNVKDCCCETRESIMQSNFNNQNGFNSVVNAINTNACNIERGQDDIRYLMAQNQNQTMIGIDRLGDRLIDFMNQEKMDTLRNELQNARFQISQSAQTEQLLSSLQPIARPAYVVNSPYQSLNYNGVNCCGYGNF